MIRLGKKQRYEDEEINKYDKRYFEEISDSNVAAISELPERASRSELACLRLCCQDFWDAWVLMYAIRSVAFQGLNLHFCLTALLWIKGSQEGDMWIFTNCFLRTIE